MTPDSASSRVVITGGTGLIGRALSSRLAASGLDVVVLSRRSPEETRVPRGCRVVRWDGVSSASWVAEADGALAIVNLAGESIAGGRWTKTRQRRIVGSRVAAADAVVDAVGQARRRPEVVLQASAVGFYGDRGDEPLDESSRAGSGFLAETTLAWERATARVEELGMRRVLLRTGLVLARDGGALAAMTPPFRFGLGGRLGDGRQWMPWIHLDDEVGAIVHLLERREARGPFNLCAPEPATNAAFTRALAQVLHRPAFCAAPAAALRLVLGEMSNLVLGGQRVRPRRLLESGFSFRFPELSGALENLFP